VYLLVNMIARIMHGMNKVKSVLLYFSIEIHFVGEVLVFHD